MIVSKSFATEIKYHNDDIGYVDALHRRYIRVFPNCKKPIANLHQTLQFQLLISYPVFYVRRYEQDILILSVFLTLILFCYHIGKMHVVFRHFPNFNNSYFVLYFWGIPCTCYLFRTKYFHKLLPHFISNFFLPTNI